MGERKGEVEGEGKGGRERERERLIQYILKIDAANT